MTVRWHQDRYDYEGYGVYEFTHPMRGYGQLPAGVSIGDVIANMDDYIVDVGGIQVAATNVQQPLIDTLDKMDFAADGDDGAVTVTGTASFGIFSSGSDFASQYLKDGYAVMGRKDSVAAGAPKMMMTQIASVIADNAFVGGPYVVVAAPQSLLEQAQAAAKKPGQPAPPPGQPAPGQQPPPPGTAPPPGTQPSAPPAQAATGTSEWMLPAVVAVGGLALIAAFAAVGSKPKRRGAR
jgi:hypothetical protein